MSSRPELRFALVLALVLIGPGLAACGFEPLYGKPQPGSRTADLSLIQVENIPDRTGQQLRNYLIDRTDAASGRRPPAKYSLRVTIAEGRSSLAYLQNSTTTTTRLDLSGSYVLVDLATGKVVTRGYVTATDSYDQLEGGYSSVAGEAGARERAARQLGEGILNRISLSLSAP